MWRAWRSGLLVAVAVLLLTTATGCGDQSGTAASPDAATQGDATPAADALKPQLISLAEVRKQLPGLPVLTEKATIQLTVKGQPVTIEVDGENAPLTAGNFIELVQKKFYDGLVFHRVVRDPSPFVVQGGDPKGKDPNVPLDQLGKGGYIDPSTNQERRIPLEIKPSAGETLYGRTFSQVPDFSSKVPKLKHTRGALAMARSMNPNSASSQFYITLADVSFLNGEYAVFGKVTEGMEVIDKIQQGDRIDSIRIVQMNEEAFEAGKQADASASDDAAKTDN